MSADRILRGLTATSGIIGLALFGPRVASGDASLVGILLVLLCAAAIVAALATPLFGSHHPFSAEVRFVGDMETTTAMARVALQGLAPSSSVTVVRSEGMVELRTFVPRVARLIGEEVMIRLVAQGDGVLVCISSRANTRSVFDLGTNKAHVTDVVGFLRGEA